MDRRWQTRRSALNHEWLKNTYLNRLDGFLERTRMPQPDLARLVRFIMEDFTDWENKRPELINLFNTFEIEMSPKSILVQNDFRKCFGKDRIWLGELVHALWLVRYPVREWIASATESLAVADTKYRQVSDILKKSDISKAEDLLLLQRGFLDFKEACYQLGKAISAFPDKVLVV